MGLLTVASILPKEWNKRLVDMNVTCLMDKDLLWADYVFLTGMNIHRASFERVVKRCNHLGTKIVIFLKKEGRSTTGMEKGKSRGWTIWS